MDNEFKDPERITEAMKGGLARLYADIDIREYLMHATNIANHNVLASLKANDTDKAKEFAIRLEVLKQLLEKGKLMFAQAEKLKRAPLSELTKQHEESTS